jgi:formylglycine-generating enzyme required for sulfatase activity
MYGKPKTEATYNGTVYDVFWPFVVDKKTGAVINQRAFGHKEDDAKTTDINETSPEARAVWEKINADGGATTPVGSHKPTKEGVYDMAGNAFQWTRDWLTVSYWIELAKKGPDPVIEDESVLTSEDRNAGQSWNRGNKENATKVVKGGSWYAQKQTAQSTNHAESGMINAGGNVNGFRIVVENPVRK